MNMESHILKFSEVSIYHSLLIMNLFQKTNNICTLLHFYYNFTLTKNY